MITLQKEPFLKAIKAIKSSCGKASFQPILDTIHLKSTDGGLILTATDLHNSARTVVEANITEPIDVCVNADKLDAIINRLNNIITLNIEDAFLIIKSGNTKFNLLWLKGEEYPTRIDFTLVDNPIIIDADIFISGINKTIFATDMAEGRILHGVCLTFNNEKGFEFAATDGNRLCQVKYNIPINIKGQYVLPRKILLDLIKIIKDKVELHVVDNRIIFKSNNYLFASALLEGAYPQYQQLIPTNNTKKIEIKKSDLLNALETVVIMVNDRTNVCNFKFIDNTLVLTANCDNGKSEDYVDINSNINGEFNIAFNYRYLIEGLKAIDNETVIFEMENPLSACIIKDDSYIQLIMPVKIDA